MIEEGRKVPQGNSSNKTKLRTTTNIMIIRKIQLELHSMVESNYG